MDAIGHQLKVATVHSCDLCKPKYFSKCWFLILNHVRRHLSGLKPFNCENSIEEYFSRKCNVKRNCTISFKAHSDANFTTNDLEYQCECCLFQTNSLLFFLKHATSSFCIKKHHSHKVPSYSENINLLKSTHGSYKCTERQSLKKHVLRKPTSDKDINWFQCDHCCYKCKVKRDLKRHILQRHTSDKDIDWFKCAHCSYKCKVKGDLKRHILRRHTSDKDIDWFKCDHCSYKSKQRSNLKRHILQRHTSDKDIHWFECDHCSYKSKQKWTLEKHILQKHEDITG